MSSATRSVSTRLSPLLRRWLPKPRSASCVQLKVDVIVTSGGAVSAVKRTTSTIPIVFALSADPVGSGLVDSLARPGGNVTGLSGQSIEIGSKKLELLREVVPNLRRLAILVNAKNVNVLPEMRDVQALASALNIEVATFELRQSSDIAPAVEGLKDRADALYVVVDPFVINNRVRINTLALAARLPTIHGFREGAEASGFMSYGPHFPDQFRRAGDYVDKILRGAKPADLPVQQPTKFELVINLTTARALGLTIPESFILRADEVIE